MVWLCLHLQVWASKGLKERKRGRERERERKGCKRVKKDSTWEVEGQRMMTEDDDGVYGVSMGQDWGDDKQNKQTNKKRREKKGGFATMQTKETKERGVRMGSGID